MSLSVGNVQDARAPKVSVVIPTYNRSSLLLNAIESVLRQTFTDYELIVIDDGSTDDTRARLEPYMERIRYVYQTNKGASAAQNAGVRAARGEWVSILASDDIWLPTKLERQIEVLAALGREFGACVANCEFVGSAAQGYTAFEEVGLGNDPEFGPLDHPLKYIIGQFGLYVQSILVLRSILNDIGGFDETLGVAEDQDLIFRLSFRTRFCFVSAPLVRIDRTPGVQRLSDLFAAGKDDTCRWMESTNKKMLAHPDFVDREIRQLIEDDLINLYYGWATRRFLHLKLAVAIEAISKIHGMGHGYSSILQKIVRDLLARGGSKLVRALPRLAGER